jgi:hypothetical protein
MQIAYPSIHEGGGDFSAHPIYPGSVMASLALDPMLVAKINALLASSSSKESGSGFAAEDIVELFETFLSAQVSTANSPAHPSRPNGSLSKFPR